MAFKLFVLYLSMVFLRPIDQLAPDLMDLRPMSILWAIAFAAAINDWVQSKIFAAATIHIKLLITFWITIVVSLLTNGLFGDAVSAIGEFSTPAMLLILSSLNITSVKRMRTVCAALVCCITVLCAESLYSYHTGFLIDKLVIKQVAREDVEVSQLIELPAQDIDGVYLWRLRSVGFLSDPNDFAQAICMVMPWLLLGHESRRHLKNAIFIVVPAALMGYAALLTHSRGGMIGLGVLGFVQLVRRLGTLWGFALGGIAGAAFAVVAQVGGRGFSGKEASANERLDAWYEGLEMFKHSPIFGVGYGHFEDHHIRTAHNSFVLCFAELGSFGYICWLALIVLAFKAAYSATSAKSIDDQSLGWAMTASLSAFLACSWFLSRSYQPSLFMLFGLCFATGFATTSYANKSVGENETLKWIRPTLVLYIVSIVGVSLFVRSAK